MATLSHGSKITGEIRAEKLHPLKKRYLRTLRQRAWESFPETRGKFITKRTNFYHQADKKHQKV